MASTYSDLKLELIGTGDQSGTWGNTTNINLGTAIEEAITGSADVTFASADVTLTLTNTNTSQTARNLRLNLTGTVSATQNLIVPAIEKQYIVNNTLGYAITVKCTGGVDTGVAVPAGKSMILFNNGVNVTEAITYTNASIYPGAGIPNSTGTAWGTSYTTSGSGTVVALATSPSLTSPTLTTPILGTPTSGTLTNCTGLPISTGVSGLGTGVSTFLTTPSSANLAAAVSDETGSGALVFGTSPTISSPTLTGTPTAPTPVVSDDSTRIATTEYVVDKIAAISAGVTSFSAGTTGLTPATTTTGAVTLGGTLAVANGGTGTTTSTGTGATVRATSPTLTTPALGTPSSGTLTSCTGLPLTTGVTGTLPVANGGTGSTSTTYCSLTTNVTGTLPVANGGTGQTTYTNGQLLIGNTTGNTLTKATLTAGTGISITNGTGSISIAATATSGFSNMQVFTSSGTWTVPAGVTKCKVTVVGGGGDGGIGTNSGLGQPTYGGSGGGGGGAAIEVISGLTPGSTVSVTVGGAGATSSFGAFCSATGGAAGGSGNAGGGLGGIGSGGDLNIRGGGGGCGVTTTDGGSGSGGSSILGGGAPGGGGVSTAGGAYGGGGSGGPDAVTAGGAGAPGVVIIDY